MPPPDPNLILSSAGSMGPSAGSVGRADLLTLDDARAQARKLIAEMLSGFDPYAEKRNEKANSITLIEVLKNILQ